MFLLDSSLKAGFRFSKPVTVTGFMPTILPSITGHPSVSHHRPVCFSRLWRNRTKCLRFGPLVYSLPLYHPIRLIEEICMLDQMSGGRFELGVGRGVSPFEVGFFGVNPADGPRQFPEGACSFGAGIKHPYL